MDIARVSVKGQITIPVDIRKELGVKEGDKVAFIERDGEVILLNSNRLALEGFQRAMAGEADRVGVAGDEDVVDLVSALRKERWEKRNAGDA